MTNTMDKSGRKVIGKYLGNIGPSWMKYIDDLQQKGHYINKKFQFLHDSKGIKRNKQLVKT